MSVYHRWKQPGKIKELHQVGIFCLIFCFLLSQCIHTQTCRTQHQYTPTTRQPTSTRRHHKLPILIQCTWWIRPMHRRSQGWTGVVDWSTTTCLGGRKGGGWESIQSSQRSWFSAVPKVAAVARMLSAVLFLIQFDLVRGKKEESYTWINQNSKEDGYTRSAEFMSCRECENRLRGRGEWAFERGYLKTTKRRKKERNECWATGERVMSYMWSYSDDNLSIIWEGLFWLQHEHAVCRIVLLQE